MKAEPKGLYQKYNISKSDGTPVDPEARYIVLRIDNSGADTVAKQTMRYAGRRGVQKFAFEIEPVEPELASDIRMMLKLYEIPEAEYAALVVEAPGPTIDDVIRADNQCKGISCEGCPFQSVGGISCSPEARQIAMYWYTKGKKSNAELAAKGLRAEQAEITITDEIDAAEESGHSGTDYVVGLQVALNALRGVE